MRVIITGASHRVREIMLQKKLPSAVAKEIYWLATADIPTGKFWREGRVREW